MDESKGLFAVYHAPKLDEGYVDARLEDHYDELIKVADGKVQEGIINPYRETDGRTLVNGAWGFPSTTDLTKRGIRQTTEIAFKIAKASNRYVPTLAKQAHVEVCKTSYKADSEKCNATQLYLLILFVEFQFAFSFS